MGDVALREAFIRISTDNNNTYKIFRLEYPCGDVNVGIASDDVTNSWKPRKRQHESGLMQLDDITLPDDLLWINEFDWNPVAQSTERSLSGALPVQEEPFTHGRSVVLSGNGEAGWVSRLPVKSL